MKACHDLTRAPAKIFCNIFQWLYMRVPLMDGVADATPRSVKSRSGACVSRMPKDRLRRELLKGFVANPRPIGSPLMTWKRTLKKALIKCGHSPSFAVCRQAAADRMSCTHEIMKDETGFRRPRRSSFLLSDRISLTIETVSYDKTCVRAYRAARSPSGGRARGGLLKGLKGRGRSVGR